MNVNKGSAKISVIIPTLNESEQIVRLLTFLDSARVELIIADGGSTDRTAALATTMGAKVVHCGVASRPFQMNRGAEVATGDVFWFVHADTLPPREAVDLIHHAVQNKVEVGSFRFRFDRNGFLFRVNSYMTRLPVMMVRGGDQGIFISRKLFNALNGYNERYVVMEEYDLIRRACRWSQFRVLPAAMLVSARKYEHNSYFRVNVANLLVFTLFYLGMNPVKLKRIYTKIIRHPKWSDA